MLGKGGGHASGASGLVMVRICAMPGMHGKAEHQPTCINGCPWQILSLADPVLGRSCPCHSEELSGTHTGRRTMGLRLRCIHDCHALLIPLLSFIPLFAWFLWEHTAWLCNKLFAFALLAPSMSHFLHSLPFCGFMPWHVAILFHLISESYCAISMMFYCLAFVGGGPTEHLSFCNFLAMFQRHCPKYYSIFLLSC